MINDPSLTSNLKQLVRRRAVFPLSHPHSCYCGFCSSELALSVPIPLAFAHLSGSHTFGHPYQVSVQKFPSSHPVLFFLKTTKMLNTILLSVFPSSCNLSLKAESFECFIHELFPESSLQYAFGCGTYHVCCESMYV